MKPGFVRCPECRRPVQVKSGFIREHWERLGKPGAGFQSLSSKCPASKKKVEEL